MMRRLCRPAAVFGAIALTSVACATSAPPLASDQPRATPVYNQETGKLEQLVSDANGDGKPDTRAFMDGAAFKHVEIDRNADGRPDRWEYYEAGTAEPGRVTPAGQSVLVRADEANGSDDKVTRHEFYAHGVIARVEEDTDGDGRIDKWERYEDGALKQMDLDLSGRGIADRRLIYGTNGAVARMEIDTNGDGTFVPAPAPSTATSGRGGGR